MRGPQHSAKLFVLRKFLPKGGKDVSFSFAKFMHKREAFRNSTDDRIHEGEKEDRRTNIGPRRLN